MAKTIEVELSAESISQAIREVKRYKNDLLRKLDEICRRAAELGATNASLGYARAVYTGNKDVFVSVEEIPGGYAIVANGESVLFLEFGAGATYGYGHPEAAKYGMGPGTYPDGKGHWDDPRGWYLPKEKGGGHTFGNPPSAAMYETAKELPERILQIAREVFASG